MVLAKGNIYSVITVKVGNNITVESGVGFTTGAAFVYEAIEELQRR
jgi:hypothetical protein